MIDLQRFKYIRMKNLEKIEKMIIEEIDQLKQMKLSELNKIENIKLEEIDHLEQIKLSLQERFKKIKEEEKEKISNLSIIKFNDIEAYKAFLSKLFNDFEIFSKNEMENLERIEKDEIEQMDKITKEDIEQHNNFLTKNIEEHKKFLIEEKNEHISFKKFEIFLFKKLGGTQPRIIAAGPPKNTNKYQNDIKIHVIFRIYNSELNNVIGPTIMIECSLNDKIEQLIEKYKERIGHFSQNKKFLYKNCILPPFLTVKDIDLYDGCLIKVINA